MMLKIRIFLISFLLVFSAVSASGQNYDPSQIAAAKQMAKAQGYSDAEIEKMFSNDSRKAPADYKKVSPTDVRTVNRPDRQNRPDRRTDPFDYRTDPLNRRSGYDMGRMENWSDTTDMEDRNRYIDALENPEEQNADRIYGHDFFESPNMNFVPSLNIPTPENYRLAPGDEVVLDIWGSANLHLTGIISPDGNITIPEIGPVYLVGYTVQKAEEYLKSYLSKYYATLSDETKDTHLRLTLGKIRTITVNVVGDVKEPGTYSLPSLSTLLSGIYMAGGPTDLGTLRDIKLYRKGRLATTFDLYAFFHEGKSGTGVRLEDDDIIIVGPNINMVKIAGGIKRPMIYEVKEKESLSDLLRYAGGFVGGAQCNLLHVNRLVGQQTSTFDVAASDFDAFPLMDGDSVTVLTNRIEYQNEVYITGAVEHPGAYSIASGSNRLSQLFQKAGGLRQDAFRSRGIIRRLDQNKDTLSVNFIPEDIISGKNDVILQTGDFIRIFPSYELKEYQYVITTGELNQPDTLSYMKGMTLADVILLSKGLKIGAAENNIDIARRIFNGNTSGQDTISVLYHIDLLESPEKAEFELKPYDIVMIRKDPSYKPQQSISINGEVKYPGNYVIERNVVRISDVFQRSGGYTNDAYLNGVVIRRQLTDEEFKRIQIATDLAKQQMGADSSAVTEIDRNERYNIAVNIDEALKNPQSYADIILKSGDEIYVPKMNNTVRISGSVLFKNVVPYDPSLSPKDYINMAGGYLKNAIKRKTHIVYMNGMVSRKGTSRFKVEPGCEIIVPGKNMQNRGGMSPAEVASLASSTASVATMVVSLVSMLK